MGNIYRYVLSAKMPVWSTNAIEIVLVFSKNILSIKIVYEREGDHGRKHVLASHS